MAEEAGLLSIAAGRVQLAWALGGVALSIITALVTSITYVKSQLERIDALEQRSNSLEKKIESQDEKIEQLKKSIPDAIASVLPPQPVSLSLANDCGGSMWAKLDQASGRFLAASGKTPDQELTFQPGFQGSGTTKIKLRPENLPPIDVAIVYDTEKAALQNGGYIYMTGLTNNPPNTRGTYQLKIGGSSQAIETIPPWYGVTACQHK